MCLLCSFLKGQEEKNVFSCFPYVADTVYEPLTVALANMMCDVVGFISWDMTRLQFDFFKNLVNSGHKGLCLEISCISSN